MFRWEVLERIGLEDGFGFCPEVTASVVAPPCCHNPRRGFAWEAGPPQLGLPSASFGLHPCIPRDCLRFLLLDSAAILEYL